MMEHSTKNEKNPEKFIKSKNKDLQPETNFTQSEDSPQSKAYLLKEPQLSSSPINYNYLFKVSLIGDAGTGKTSILLRFTENHFKQNTQSTIGVDFKIVSVSIDDCVAKLQIWDTCGSERFKSLTASFIKSCSVFILVYDITKRETFESLDSWLKIINESTTPKLICMVGNKADLENNRKVSKSEALEFSQKNNLNFYETSAKSNKNIEEVFIYVTETLYEGIKQRKKSEFNETGFEIGAYKSMVTLGKDAENLGSDCKC